MLLQLVLSSKQEGCWALVEVCTLLRAVQVANVVLKLGLWDFSHTNKHDRVFFSLCLLATVSAAAARLRKRSSSAAGFILGDMTGPMASWE